MTYNSTSTDTSKEIINKLFDKAAALTSTNYILIYTIYLNTIAGSITYYQTPIYVGYINTRDFVFYKIGFNAYTTGEYHCKIYELYHDRTSGNTMLGCHGLYNSSVQAFSNFITIKPGIKEHRLGYILLRS